MIRAERVRLPRNGAPFQRSESGEDKTTEVPPGNENTPPSIPRPTPNSIENVNRDYTTIVSPSWVAVKYGGIAQFKTSYRPSPQTVRLVSRFSSVPTIYSKAKNERGLEGMRCSEAHRG
ncbi:hypothetical protein ZHAS_00013040 [Anopheles sinensis]|uniref:Uncharacterized protein n=1 Tax=Anopheles sinensis TaxID=74873 RepID=A0A084W4D1_ANOSI|nr:hypothetical protein ZHAS_00013040 [Anopheles sinensis]